MTRRRVVRLLGILVMLSVLATAGESAVSTEGRAIWDAKGGLNRSWFVVSDLDGSAPAALTPRSARVGRYTERAASWSPDGMNVGYVRTVNEVDSIRVTDLSGRSVLTVRPAEIRRLGGAGAFPGAPLWSRSGRDLLFGVNAGAGFCRTPAIARAPLDGGPVQTIWRLAPSATAVASPMDVSPDGERTLIKVVTNDGECRYGHFGLSALRIVAADTTLRRPTGLEFIYEASWSSDGLMIVLSGGCDPVCQLYRFSADGRRKTQLTHFRRTENAQVDFDNLSWKWLPDGRVLVARARSLFVIDPVRATTRTLLTLPCPPENLGCSSTTSTELFAVSKGGARAVLQTFDFGTDSLLTRGFVIDIAGATAQPLPLLKHEWTAAYIP